MKPRADIRRHEDGHLGGRHVATANVDRNTFVRYKADWQDSKRHLEACLVYLQSAYMHPRETPRPDVLAYHPICRAENRCVPKVRVVSWHWAVVS